MAAENTLRLPALRIRQSPNREVISFAVDGKLLETFAAVSRVRRDDDGRLGGYQRPEVLRHVAGIRRYLDSADPILPGSLVIAFDDRVRFEVAGDDDALGVHGWLWIPLNAEHKPGLLVDGQQRAGAIREAQRTSMPVFCSGFVARDESDQRSQFVRVNSAKPLPRRLIHELLPATDDDLPAALARRRFPAMLLERLNQDTDSPLRGAIDTPTTAGGRFKDTSILRMIEASLTDGALFLWRDPATGRGDTEAMLGLLKRFWTAVELTWPEAFAGTARESRLVHGAGVHALGAVMDELADRSGADLTVDGLAGWLAAIAPRCAWTSGVWSFDGGQVRRFNDIQNTGSDLRLLADHLTRAVRQAQPSAAAPAPPGALDDEDARITLAAVAVAAGRAGRARAASRQQILQALPAETAWTSRALAIRLGRLHRAYLLRDAGDGQLTLTVAGQRRLDDLQRAQRAA